MKLEEFPSQIIRFGSFELDLQEGRLSKAGLRIRLQGQPYQILTILLERAGELVGREEIRQKLWSDQTFVEFDDALNTAVGKLRAALGDTADNPRFVETVPRRGYRFIAPVVWPARPERRQQPTPARPQTLPPVTKNGVARAPATPLAFRPLPVAGARRGWLSYLLAAAGVAVILAVAAAAFWRLHRPVVMGPKDDILVVADFVNTTGEPVFEDALRQALEIGLQQSPSVQIVADRKTSAIFAQMGHSPEDHLSGKSALEVCQRAGGKVAVQGSIASLGTVYLLGLAAIRCDTGEPIANVQGQAHRKEDVIDTLGQATAQLRAQLGESLPSIQSYNAPLEQATTTSLEALNAYSMALATWDKKGDRESLPIFRKAVELDPNFAQAYSSLATIYHNMGQSDLARQNATRAYELREHVTLVEKVSIEARYYAYVTGELEKSAEVRGLQAQNHPDSANALNHLGNVNAALGQFDLAVENYRQALRLDPARSGSYSGLASALLAINKVDEAAAVLAEATRRSLHSDDLLQANYWIAFLREDSEGLARMLQQTANSPEPQALLLSEQANTEAYAGHFDSAWKLSRKASTLMEQQGDKDTAALYLGQAAVREAEAGDQSRAGELIVQALRLSQDDDVTALTALAAARSGRLQMAEALSAQLNHRLPAGTYVQKYWLPTIRAAMELKKGQPAKALDALSLVNSSLEQAAPLAFSTSTFYPVYLRGQAYLAAGDGARAAIEFQKLRDHRPAIANHPLASLSMASLARANARLGDTRKAKQNFKEFLTVWKDADPDLPLLKECKLELSSLP